MLGFNPSTSGGGEAMFQNMDQTVAQAVGQSIDPHGTGGDDPLTAFMPGMPDYGGTTPAQAADPNFQGFGSMNPGTMAADAAQTIFPFMQAQKDAGIFQEAPMINAPPGSQNTWDTIGSMLSGGGGYDVNYTPEEMNPEVAALLEDSPYLSDFYNPGEDLTTHQYAWDDVLASNPIGEYSQSYSFTPNELDPTVAQALSANPFLQEFYDAAPKAEPVNINTYYDESQVEGLRDAPSEQLYEAIHGDYSDMHGVSGVDDGHGLVPGGFGGSWADQQEQTSDLIANLMAQTHADFGDSMPDDFMGSVGEIDPTTGLPSGSDIPTGLSFAPPEGWEAPAWMDEFMPNMDLVETMGSGMDVGATGQHHADNLANPQNYLSESLEHLQGIMPEIYTPQE